MLLLLAYFQIDLSKKHDKRLGLIMPYLSLALSLLIATVTVIHLSDSMVSTEEHYYIAYGGESTEIVLPLNYIDAANMATEIDYVYLISTALGIFLVANVPTVLLFVIYYIYKNTRRKKGD